ARQRGPESGRPEREAELERARVGRCGMRMPAGLVLLIFAVACAPLPQSGPSGDSALAPQPARFKRVVGAILGDPAIIYRGQKITLPAPAGNDELEELVMSGLTGVSGDDAHLVPKLAEIVPSI